MTVSDSTSVEDQMLRLMVALTINGDLRRQILDAKRREGTQFPLESLEDRLKTVVLQELRTVDQGRLLQEYPYLQGAIDWGLQRELALDFFNRASAGVDAWDPDDRATWVSACREVIDIHSSVYP